VSNSANAAATNLQRDFVLKNQYGLHARPAALFVKVASQYDADVFVEKDGNQVSGKSILGLMTLEASCGCVLRVSASGKDAQRVLEELEQLVQRKFDEA
jgi:phosphocarrier protein HPr